MKHSVTFALVLSFLVLSCGSPEGSSDRESLLEASKQELATALSERDQLLSLMKEITVSMSRIKTLENIMTVEETNPNEASQHRVRILSDISAVQQSLQQRREQLAELEKRLEESSLYTDELKEIVAVMRKQIDSQSTDIKQLLSQLKKANLRIESLNVEVDSLTMAVDSVSRVLDAAQLESKRLEDELNECYYVVASKSDLKKHKIIETGFLRKSKLMQGDFDSDFFSTGDKREIDTIELQSDKAKIYTNHPLKSYLLIEDGKRKTLVISDPEKFWSLTNYLVVQID